MALRNSGELADYMIKGSIIIQTYVPANQLNTIAFILLFTAIVTCWVAFAFFIRITIRASLTKRKAVLSRLMQIMFLLGGWWYWRRKPEKESNPQKKEIKKYKMFLHVRLGAALYPILALFIFFIGLVDIKREFLWFQVFSLLVSPWVGLIGTYFWFMYYLMKDTDYFDKSLLPD